MKYSIVNVHGHEILIYYSVFIMCSVRVGRNMSNNDRRALTLRGR
jgi:hypothetical protein